MKIQREINKHHKERFTEFIEYDGFTFYHDKRGYWTGSVDPNNTIKRLHIYVWEKHNGVIPKGYCIHHIDENKNNNNIENLKLMIRHDHLSLHASKEEAKTHMRIIAGKDRPLTKDWHASKEGNEWHKKHYEISLGISNTTKIIKICECCGKEYTTNNSKKKISKFCSSKCKDKQKDIMGTYDEERTCVICGTKFMTYRYGTVKTCCKSCSSKYVWSIRCKG